LLSGAVRTWLKVDVIVTHGTANVVAAKNTTSVIPIVFAAVSDPVGTNLVVSLGRPGSNVTGLSNEASDLAGKRLELLREIIPGVGRLAILANVGNPAEVSDVQTAARALGLKVAILGVRTGEDIAAGITGLNGRADAIYVQSDPFFNFNRVQINALAQSVRLPTVSGFRQFTEAGGLMSYGPNFPDLFRRAAEYVDKILRGTKAGELPVEQPTKFDLVFDLKTAKALGFTIPPILLARAAELIETAPDANISTTSTATRALMNATAAIPIVAAITGDPIGLGFTEDLSHPTGNVTGFSTFNYTLAAKRLEMLREIVPAMRTVALMWVPANPQQVLLETQTRAAVSYRQTQQVKSPDLFRPRFDPPQKMSGASEIIFVLGLTLGAADGSEK
jgi:putative ABC transport system substrate-binding protein